MKFIGQLFFLVLFSLCFLSACQNKGAESTGHNSLKFGHKSAGGESLSGSMAQWSGEDFPLQMGIAQDFSAEENDEISAAISSWRNLAQTPANFLSESNDTLYDPLHASITAYEDGEIGIYKREEWFKNLSSQVLALTQYSGEKYLTPSGKQVLIIRHADIFVNYEHYAFSTQFPPGLGQFDLQTAVLHEMGHLLGLAHFSEGESVMFPSLARREMKRMLQIPERNQLATLYPSLLRPVPFLNPAFAQIEEEEGVDGGELTELTFQGKFTAYHELTAHELQAAMTTFSSQF